MKKTLGLAAVVVVALTGASAAYAAPGSGDTEIYACRAKATGVLRIIDKGKRCSTSETATSWAKTGPAGKQGAPGVAGPKGASPVVYVRESTVPLPPGVVTFVPAVTCDPDDTAIGVNEKWRGGDSPAFTETDWSPWRGNMTADPVTGLMTGTAATGIDGYVQEMDDPDPAGDGWERIRVQCLKIA